MGRVVLRSRWGLRHRPEGRRPGSRQLSRAAVVRRRAGRRVVCRDRVRPAAQAALHRAVQRPLRDRERAWLRIFGRDRCAVRVGDDRPCSPSAQVRFSVDDSLGVPRRPPSLFTIAGWGGVVAVLGMACALVSHARSAAEASRQASASDRISYAYREAYVAHSREQSALLTRDAIAHVRAETDVDAALAAVGTGAASLRRDHATYRRVADPVFTGSATADSARAVGAYLDNALARENDDAADRARTLG